MIGFEGLRVALIGPVPPPAGGMAMQTQQLKELLEAAQARVTLVPTNAPYRPAFVGRWPGVRAAFRLLPYAAALWRAAGRCELFHVMANSGWSWHLFAGPAIWVARLRRVPVVVNYRGGEADRFLASGARWVRASMRQVARLVVPSAFLQQVFARHGMVAQVVPNIVDTQRFHPPHPAGPRPAWPQLLVARNLEPIYDNANALRAFAIVLRRYPDAVLILAGTGPLEAELKRQAAELGVEHRVRFAGRLSREDMAEVLRASTIALNPSTVDNMPNSVLEALASGVPVVSTRVGGVPYVVEDGITALLVPASDPDAMAHAVLALLDDPARACRMSAAGLQAARAYTWERIGPQWIEVYRSALRPAV